MIGLGKVKGPLSLATLLDSAKMAAQWLKSLHPLKHKTEFEQYVLMAQIRVQYLTYQVIESGLNSATLDKESISLSIKQLETVLGIQKNKQSIY